MSMTAKETEAYVLAVEWAVRDPEFGGGPLTDRESALMRLAIRAYVMPTAMGHYLRRLEAGVPIPAGASGVEGVPSDA